MDESNEETKAMVHLDNTKIPGSNENNRRKTYNTRSSKATFEREDGADDSRNIIEID